MVRLSTSDKKDLVHEIEFQLLIPVLHFTKEMTYIFKAVISEKALLQITLTWSANFYFLPRVGSLGPFHPLSTDFFLTQFLFYNGIQLELNESSEVAIKALQ